MTHEESTVIRERMLARLQVERYKIYKSMHFNELKEADLKFAKNRGVYIKKERKTRSDKNK